MDEGRKRDVPEFPDDLVSAVLERIGDLDGEIAADVVVGGGLLVFAVVVWDWENLWASGGDDVLILGTRLRAHVRVRTGRTRKRERDGRLRNLRSGQAADLFDCRGGGLIRQEEADW